MTGLTAVKLYYIDEISSAHLARNEDCKPEYFSQIVLFFKDQMHLY